MSQSNKLVLLSEEDIEEGNFGYVHPDFDDPLVHTYFQAVDRSDIATIIECLRAGLNINVYDMNGRTIFHHAASNGSLTLVKTIINWPKRNLNTRTFDFLTTPLQEAIINERHEIVEIYLKAGALPNIPNAHGSTTVHIAVKLRSIKILHMLIMHHANLNVNDKFSNTPLSVAILDIKDYPISSILLRHGAIVNWNRPNTLYILHEAVLNCNCRADIFLIRLLVRHGALINFIDETGRNALHYGAMGGLMDLIRYLLYIGVNPRVQDKSGRCPVEVARDHGHKKAELFIQDHIYKTLRRVPSITSL